MSNYCNGFLPPGDRQPWPDAPFKVPAGELPARKPQPFGNRDRATAIIWHWLDQRLDNPIHAEHSPHRSRIWVLDVFYYEVDRDLRQLRGGIVGPEGHLEPAAEILLSNPLRLERMLRRMAPRIFRNWPKEEGVAVMFPNGGDQARESVMSSVWLRLSEDPRFKLLAHTVLLHELALDPAIFRLATTACRWFEELRACDYQAAWQNMGAFRKVEAENPRLLALLPLYLEAQSDRLGPEPVGELKRWFIAQGLSDAAWRYLATSDLWGFAPLWKRVTKPNRLLATVKFLRLLEKAGFPEQVQPRVTTLWIDALAEPAAFERSGSGWRLKELAGPENRSPKPSVAAMAVKVAEALGRASEL